MTQKEQETEVGKVREELREKEQEKRKVGKKEPADTVSFDSERKKKVKAGWPSQQWREDGAEQIEGMHRRTLTIGPPH